MLSEPFGRLLVCCRGIVVSVTSPPTFENYPDGDAEGHESSSRVNRRVSLRTFENYPGDGAGSSPLSIQSTDDDYQDREAEDGAAAGHHARPGRQPQRYSRRAVLTVATGGAALVALSYAAVRNSAPDEPVPARVPTPSSSSPGSDEDQPSKVDVGIYTVSFSDAWTVQGQGPDVARLVHDFAVVIFRSYEAEEDVETEARRNLGKLTGDLAGGTVRTIKWVRVEPYRAQSTIKGRQHGRSHSAEAMVCMNRHGDEALAVTWLVDDRCEDAIKKELLDMRMNFLGQFL